VIAIFPDVVVSSNFHSFLEIRCRTIMVFPLACNPYQLDENVL